MAKYKKLTQKQIDIMKIYWWFLQRELNIFYKKANELEEKMAHDTKIKDIEFFMGEYGYVGIGNVSKTIKLYQKEELEA